MPVFAEPRFTERRTPFYGMENPVLRSVAFWGGRRSATLLCRRVYVKKCCKTVRFFSPPRNVLLPVTFFLCGKRDKRDNVTNDSGGESFPFIFILYIYIYNIIYCFVSHSLFVTLSHCHVVTGRDKEGASGHEACIFVEIFI